jgi:hypothetical protein
LPGSRIQNIPTTALLKNAWTEKSKNDWNAGVQKKTPVKDSHVDRSYSKSSSNGGGFQTGPNSFQAKRERLFSGERSSSKGKGKDGKSGVVH